MSSCKWENGKAHGAVEAKAILRHNDISYESRKIAQKGNEYIDLTKVKYNTSRYGRSYKECCQIYDKRVAELDAMPKQNRKPDRVTMCSVEVPAPEDLPRERMKEWFDRLGDIFEERYGKENIIEIYVHYDEEHEYDDAETGEKRLSRIHANVEFVPEVNGKFNAKQLSLRRNMKELNRVVHEMTESEFGCQFMDGSKKRSTKTVSQLKNESNERQLFRESEEAKKQITDATIKTNSMKLERKRLNDDWEELQKRERKLNARQTSLNAAERVLEVDRQTYKAEIEKELKTAYTALETDLRCKYAAKSDKLHAEFDSKVETLDGYINTLARQQALRQGVSPVMAAQSIKRSMQIDDDSLEWKRDDYTPTF